MASDASLEIVLPRALVKGAKSRVAPTRSESVGDVIQNSALYGLLNTSARDYRSQANITTLMRHLARAEGPFSGAVHSTVAVANGSHTVTAYDAATHAFSQEGTVLANSVVASFDTLYDYSQGFSTKKSMEILKAHGLRETVLTGAIAAELVLNEARLPSHIQIVPYETLEMVATKDGYAPQQTISGSNDPVNLNIPTFFVSTMQQNADSAYGFSMMDSAIKMIVYFEEFMEDIRRSIRQTGHARNTYSIDAKRIMEMAPPQVRTDKKTALQWVESVRSALQEQINSLRPEEALVMFDYIKNETVDGGNKAGADYTPMLTILAGIYATSMKTPPSALGLRLEGGSQALGNVETLVYLKTVKLVQSPFEELMSRVLTLSCRLYGMDVYVRFQFDGLNLRPEDELEAFKTMEQTRILELLSLGFISDEMAAHLLKTGPRPEGAPPLSGTMFASQKSAVDPALGTSAMGRTLQADKEVPRKAGGKSQ